MASELNIDFPTLPRESLRDRTIDVLRSAIVTGEIAPGTRLSEVSLSNSLGISRGTLREALSVLKGQGLAIVDRRGRTSVPDLNPTMVRDIFQVREALELMAARLVIEQDMTEATAALLEDRVVEMRLSQDGSLLDQVDTDMAFHQTLCAAAGNEILLENWENISGRVRMAILFSGADQAQRNMRADRHQELISQLRTGSTSIMDDGLREHFRAALSGLLGQRNTGQHQ